MYDFSKLIFPLLNQPFNIFDPSLSSMSIIFFSNLKIYQQVFVSKSLYCKVSEAERTTQT